MNARYLLAISAATITAAFTPAMARAATPQPAGDPGSWKLAFDTEFNGTALPANKWTVFPYDNSNVQGNANDVTVAGGYLTLILSQEGSGSSYGAGGFIESTSYQLPVGAFMEARIRFPGPGTTPGSSIYNWSGFWASGNDWPTNGEEDAVETLGAATSNYHYGSQPNQQASPENSGTIPGDWSNSFHTYGIYRGAMSCTVYFDGQAVYSYPTHDAGGAQEILLDAASSTGPDATINAPAVTGSASAVKVDYVRAWVPR